MNVRRSNSASQIPTIDESWWEAVLAEDRAFGTRAPARRYKRVANGTDASRENGGRIPPDWDRARELFQLDQIVSLQVTAYNRGGLLVEGQDLRGFVPFSHLVGVMGQLEQVDRNRLLDSYIGRTLRLKVIECVPEDGRIVFSERAALAEPGKRTELFRSLQSGEQIVGTVTNITDFGVFVDLGGVEGLIHISELSWGRVVHPSHVVHMGDSVKVQVLELSAERCRVALSLKRLLPNPWSDFSSEVDIGQPVPAVITSVLSYGAFAQLERGVEGLIHSSEMPLHEGQSVKDFIHLGQPVQVRVLHVDAIHQRMGLSMKLNEP